jgi:hypothetical protein
MLTIIAACMITGMISNLINQSLRLGSFCFNSFNDAAIDHTSHSDQHNT